MFLASICQGIVNIPWNISVGKDRITNFAVAFRFSIAHLAQNCPRARIVAVDNGLFGVIPKVIGDVSKIGEYEENN